MPPSTAASVQSSLAFLRRIARSPWVECRLLDLGGMHRTHVEEPWQQTTIVLKCVKTIEVAPPQLMLSPTTSISRLRASAGARLDPRLSQTRPLRSALSPSVFSQSQSITMGRLACDTRVPKPSAVLIQRRREQIRSATPPARFDPPHNFLGHLHR